MFNAYTACVTVVATIYWYLNRHKPVMHVLKELRTALHMQGVGIAGLIDDKLQGWRNKLPEIPETPKRVAVVTGGGRGIGKEVVRELLQANCVVVVGLRSPVAVDAMKKELESPTDLLAFPLDLNSLESVRSFASTVAAIFPEIHLLVNNAGVMFGDYKLTVDGVESQFAVNYLGHFYLSHLLLPALKKGGMATGCTSRVVNVTSCGHYPARINFEDVNMEEHYDTTEAYARSKLAQIMSARYVNKLMEDEIAPVRCYSVHPGIVNTDLFEGTSFRKYNRWFMNLFFKTPAQGAIPIVYASFSKDLDKQGGLYISNGREGYSNSFSKNPHYQQRLHLISCQMVGIASSEFGQSKKC